MAVKVHSKPSDRSIHIKDMMAGDIGVITKWGENVLTIGEVIQRHKDRVVFLGSTSNFGYHTIHTNYDCRVEILPPGTLLEIT
jgi:hypothetical protein